MKSHDSDVESGGGAGRRPAASLSLSLASAGHEVHVYERHSSVAPLGAGVLIQPQGIEALSDLGVGEPFAAVSAPITRLLRASHRRWPLVDLDYGRRYDGAPVFVSLGIGPVFKDQATSVTKRLTLLS